MPRTVLLPLLLFALLLGAAPAHAALPPLSADPDPRNGGRIVDASGREVLLRGVNTDVLSDAPVLGRIGSRTLESIGWNAVRIQLAWPRIEPLPGRFDDKHLDDVERLVDALASKGIYSVLAVQPRGLVPGGLPIAGARTPASYTVMLRRLARRFATQPGVAAFDVVDAHGSLAAMALSQIRAGENDAGATASPHLVFVGPSSIGAVTSDRAVVLAPRGTTVGALGSMRQAALGGAPVVVSEWTPGADAPAHQDAQNGLRLGSFASTPGLIDPRGPLSRAYVRAAPGRLEFSHYEEPRGHFAARGMASSSNTAPIEIFYPGAKHKGAKFRARGISGLKAAKVPGGGRMVTGIPRGRWSFQIGPSLK
ncbi:MAG: hypothetical protein AVDCRST_MAG85-1399 [uncultured Solirubrobacteraceae bacterium]|uniref:Glycoside hydrolase family 5 domain-containing protein n=1 Tax=uncultured Solirubrobacteraceae bacterium TaxID=1162706 RepID=A0A6J4SBJ4_9ACTN|nr:MAG: hypothetical protein AVDCRST_MAG85-1399 [uncultured Solirubrobacteraceae bacterium]